MNDCKVPCKIGVTEVLRSEGDFNSSLTINLSPFLKNSEKNREEELAEKGSVLHQFIKMIDFNKAKKNLEGYIKELTDKKLLDLSASEKIDLRIIKKFLKSSLVERILSSEEVLKEFEFSTKFPLDEIFEDVSSHNKDLKITLNGTVDCAFLEDDQFVIVDYKLGGAKNEEKYEIYKKQLILYKKALEKISNKKVKDCIIYSLSDGKELIF